MIKIHFIFYIIKFVFAVYPFTFGNEIWKIYSSEIEHNDDKKHRNESQ